MKTIFAILFLFVFVALCYSADYLKNTWNPFTGNWDKIINLSSTPVSALLGGTTLAATVDALSLSTTSLSLNPSNTNYIQNQSASVQVASFAVLSGSASVLYQNGVDLLAALKSTAALSSYYYSVSLSSIATLQLATATLAAQTTFNVLNPSNTNYVNLSGSTQTKTGGLNLMGRLGSGTAEPESNFHIKDVSPIVYVQGGNEFAGPRVRFRNSGGSISSNTIVTQPDYDAGALYWDAYNGSEWKSVGAFLVTGDGSPSASSLPSAFNFLTTSPNQVSATQKMSLNSSGDLSLHSINASDTHKFGIGTFTVDSGAQFQINRSTFYVMTNGNVGIGTNNPAALFHVSPGSFVFTGSNLGVGAAEPLGKFDIVGAVGSGGSGNSRLLFPGAIDIAQWQLWGNYPAGPVLSLSSDYSTGYNSITSGTGDPLFIGGTPLANLEAVYISTHTGIAGEPKRRVGVGVQNPALKGQFQVGGGSLTVMESGDIGIGTTNPLAKIDVVGKTGERAALLVSQGEMDLLLRAASATSGPQMDILSSASDQSSSIISASTHPIYMGMSPTAFLPVVLVSSSGRVSILGPNRNPTGIFQVGGGSLTVLQGGNVGIGTTNPGRMLQLVTSNVGEGIEIISSFALDPFSGSGVRAFALNNPTAADQRLGWYLYGTTTAAGAATTGFSEAAWSSTSRPTNLRFETIANGTTSRTEKMRISADGNVGIGTTAPTEEFHVKDSVGSSYLQAILESAGPAGLSLRPNGDNWEIQGVNSAGSPANSLIFYNRTDGEYRMIIDGGGNIGIGTISPAAKLHIAGSRTGQINILSDITQTASGSNADQYGFINYNKMTFVGGAANHATGQYADLKVNLTAGTTVLYARSVIAVAPTNTGSGGIVQHVKSLQANAPTLGSVSNVAAYLENASIGSSYGDVTPPTNGAIIQGNVGIGTTNPGKKLTVDGNIEVGINSADYHHLRIGGGNSSGYLYGAFAKYGDGINLGYNFYNDNTNNVIDNAGGATSRLYLAYGAIGMYTGAANTEPTNLGYYQNSSGNVGIGTTSPAYKLELSADSAGKPTTNTWTITSDSRTKEDISEYTAGLNEIKQIRPITFTHNGLGGTHKGDQGVGVLAQEMRAIFPQTVSERDKIFESSDDVKGFDAQRVIVSSAVFKKQWQVFNAPEGLMEGTTVFQKGGNGNAVVFKDNDFYYLFPTAKQDRYLEVKNTSTGFVYETEAGPVFSAQNVEVQVAPEKVGYKANVLGFNSHELTFALVNAVKELSATVDELKRRIEVLEQK